MQLCGDAHLSNFGLFGTPERRLIFDINDFDETHPGPWEWDVKRLAASFEMHRPLPGLLRRRPPGRRHGLRRASTASACGRRRDPAPSRSGTTTSRSGDLLDQIAVELRRGRLRKDEARTGHGDVAKARTRDSVRVVTRRVDRVDGDLRIVAEPPLIVPIEDLVVPGTEWEQADVLVKKLLAPYRQTLGAEHHPLEEFRYVHAARKVVGVGSVGTRCYIMLLVGRDDADPLVLQVKEAQASVLEPFVGGQPGLPPPRPAAW